MHLDDYCRANKISYSKAWREFSAGRIEGARKENGRIVIGGASNPVSSSRLDSVQVSQDPIIPLIVEGSTRESRTSKQTPTDRYRHLDSGFVPVTYAGSPNRSSSDLSPKDVILLSNSAYFNFPTVRYCIDLMTELTVGNIYWKGGTAKSRKFFEAFWNKVGLWNIQDMWAREYFRSGNVFFYKILGEITPENVRKISQIYGAELNADGLVPLRYSILCPSDIVCESSISFSNAIYYKVLNAYELERLRNPRTEEDIEVLNTLDDVTKKQIKDKKNAEVRILLKPEYIVASFYKKQSYESFGVPMCFPVLEALCHHKELRILDLQVARTVTQSILLVTAGTEVTQYGGGVNQKTIEALKTLMASESVSRTLVASYDVDAKFIIPQISELLDTKKYEILEKEIQLGLNNVLMGQGDKFANQNAKLEVFVEKIRASREIFIREFLLPETKNIAKALGFKKFPEPKHEEIDLKNELEWAKLAIKMAELNILTPEETITALEHGTYPDSESSLESQAKFKTLRDKGHYKPLNAKPDDEGVAGAGRPKGSKAPQSTKKISPISAYVLPAIKDNLMLADKLETAIAKHLKKTHKIKGSLNDAQLEYAEQLKLLIMAAEAPEKWVDSIASYVKNPTNLNDTIQREIDEIAVDNNLNSYLATILYHSKVSHDPQQS